MFRSSWGFISKVMQTIFELQIFLIYKRTYLVRAKPRKMRYYKFVLL